MGICLAVAACGQADLPAQGGTTELQALGDAVCDWQRRCGALTEAEDCVLPAMFLGYTLPLRAEGRVIDGAAARECARQVRGLACEVGAVYASRFLFDVEPGPFLGLARAGATRCGEVFSGDRAMGEPCWRSEQCAAGYCTATISWLGCLEGICKPVGASGAACDQDAECAPDLTCRWISGSRQCAARLDAGEECSTGDCRAGLTCSERPGQFARCVVPAALGESCDAALTLGTDCAFDGKCAQDSGRCVALPTVGQACVDRPPACAGQSDCNFGFCEARLGVGDKCDTGTGHCMDHTECRDYRCTIVTWPDRCP